MQYNFTVNTFYAFPLHFWFWLLGKQQTKTFLDGNPLARIFVIW